MRSVEQWTMYLLAHKTRQSRVPLHNLLIDCQFLQGHVLTCDVHTADLPKNYDPRQDTTSSTEIILAWKVLASKRWMELTIPLVT